MVISTKSNKTEGDGDDKRDDVIAPKDKANVKEDGVTAKKEDRISKKNDLIDNLAAAHKLFFTAEIDGVTDQKKPALISFEQAFTKQTATVKLDEPSSLAKSEFKKGGVDTKKCSTENNSTKASLAKSSDTKAKSKESSTPNTIQSGVVNKNSNKSAQKSDNQESLQKSVETKTKNRVSTSISSAKIEESKKNEHSQKSNDQIDSAKSDKKVEKNEGVTSNTSSISDHQHNTNKVGAEKNGGKTQQDHSSLNDKMTNLLKAIEEKDEKLIQSTIEKIGTDINMDVKGTDDKYLEPALVKAASIKYPKTLNMLIQHGAHVDKQTKDANGHTPLFIAASKGYFDNVEILVKNGADVNKKIKHQEYSALHAAAKISDNAIITYLLDNKADINTAALPGPPLVRAVLYNSKVTTKLLLDRGADINKHSKSFGTAVWRSVYEKDTPVLSLLLEWNADINIRCQSDNSTPLFRAIRSNWEIGVEMLLKQGADVNISSDDMSPLCRAVRGGSEKLVKLLLDHGADVKTLSKSKQTALDMAKELQKTSIIKLLLEDNREENKDNKSDSTSIEPLNKMDDKLVGTMERLLKGIEDKNISVVKTELLGLGENINKDVLGIDGEYMQPALNKAASVDCHEILSMIIEHGADVNKSSKEEHGYTPLFLAATYGHLKNVQLLVEKKADVNLKVKYMEYSPLHAAAGKGHPAIVQYLLANKANINIMGNMGTSLYRATIYNKLTCSKILVENGADVNMHIPKYGTPLCRSVEKKDKLTVELLLDNKADINFQSSSDNSTALYKAVSSEWEEGVKVLLQRKANVNLPNKQMPPLCRAVQNQNKKIVELLLNHGADINGVGDNKKTVWEIMNEQETKDEIINLLDVHKNKTSNKTDEENTSTTTEEKNFTTNAVLVGNMETLFSAIAKKDMILLKSTLKKLGKDINTDMKGKDGVFLQPPLIKAAKTDNVDIIKTLINHGADVNKAALDGYIPLYHAVYVGKLENIKVFLENGADVNKKVKYLQYSPLHAAMKTNENVIKCLLDAGADINALGEQGTAIYRAVLYNKFSLAKLLLTRGADVNKYVSTHGTPLWRSVAEKDLSMLTLLLNSGANVNIQSQSDHSTALFKAVLLNWEEGSELLVRHNADVNIPNNLMSPLCRAVRNKNDQLVELLLKNGADVNAVSKSNETALDMVDLVLDLNVKAKIVLMLLNAPAFEKNMQQERSEQSTPRLDRTLTGSPTESISGNETVEKKDVMLSYQWDYQKQVKKIKNYLESIGKLKVWMDIEDMHGRMNTRMAEGVDNSSVIVLCMSAGYAKSRNCRKEYGYADYKAKDIIPIKMETDFSPTINPELNIIICNELYYDMGSDEKIEKELPNLLKGIKMLL